MEEKELSRNWTTIIYFEELGGIEVVKSALKTLHYSLLISPVHSPDEEGKKNHVHLLLKGEKKSKKQIRELLEKITVKKDNGSLVGVATPQSVKNLRSMVRYFVHIDDVDKQQFTEDEKKMFALDFDYKKYLVDVEKTNALKSIIDLIKEYKITSLIDLFSFCIENEIDYSYVEKHTYLVNTLIKDFNFSRTEKKVVDRLNINIV